MLKHLCFQVWEEIVSRVTIEPSSQMQITALELRGYLQQGADLAYTYHDNKCQKHYLSQHVDMGEFLTMVTETIDGDSLLRTVMAVHEEKLFLKGDLTKPRMIVGDTSREPQGFTTEYKAMKEWYQVKYADDRDPWNRKPPIPFLRDSVLFRGNRPGENNARPWSYTGAPLWPDVPGFHGVINPDSVDLEQRKEVMEARSGIFDPGEEDSVPPISQPFHPVA